MAHIVGNLILRHSVLVFFINFRDIVRSRGGTQRPDLGRTSGASISALAWNVGRFNQIRRKRQLSIQLSPRVHIMVTAWNNTY